MPDKIATRLKEIAERGIQRRVATFNKDAINVEERTVEIAFSSETESVERWYGIEVLGHDIGECDLSRMNNKAPACWMHDLHDQRGVVEPDTARIDSDRVSRCLVRFSRSPEGERLFQDVIDGIVTKVSVGYSVSGMKLVEEREGIDVYRITSWMPYEVSFVSVAADDDVGVGRSLENPPQEPTSQTVDTSTKPAVITTVKEERNMTPEEIAALEAQARTAGRADEATRMRTIYEIGERFGYAEAATEFVKDGKKTAEDFRSHVLEEQHKREQKPLNQQVQQGRIGLTDKEARAFSILKVARALIDPTDKRAQSAAAFEFEASAAAAKLSGRDSGRFLIPSDTLTRALNSQTSGTAMGDTGGYTINTTLMTQSFIEILRNRSILLQRATTMGGLVGNIDIPRQISAALGGWIGEDDDAPESELGLGQISMSPKTVSGHSVATRKLINQSSMDVEAMLRFDLAKQIALTIDKAGYYGVGGDHQPKGLALQTGIHAVSFATAGKPLYSELIEMETLIALDNADVDSMSYVGNSRFRGHTKGALKFPGVNGSATIWESGAKAKDGMVNGYSADITNQVATGDLFFGNWADLLIGMWGGLEILVDPYTGSRKGQVKITMFQDVDVAVRRNESFSLGR